jgi:hypothetical protein
MLLGPTRFHFTKSFLTEHSVSTTEGSCEQALTLPYHAPSINPTIKGHKSLSSSLRNFLHYSLSYDQKFASPLWFQINYVLLPSDRKARFTSYTVQNTYWAEAFLYHRRLRRKGTAVFWKGRRLTQKRHKTFILRSKNRITFFCFSEKNVACYRRTTT